MSVPTVLSADDSEDDRYLLQYASRKTTDVFALQLVEDGQQAINYLAGVDAYADRQRFPFPILLLLDIKMPVKNGFEVLEWLREQRELTALPVAILSSSYDRADVQRAYDLAARWYLMKPVDYDDVIRMMQLICGWVADPKRCDLSQSPYFKPPP
jgi:CheY-like chemotaxis protein